MNLLQRMNRPLRGTFLYNGWTGWMILVWNVAGAAFFNALVFWNPYAGAATIALYFIYYKLASKQRRLNKA